MTDPSFAFIEPSPVGRCTRLAVQYLQSMAGDGLQTVANEKATGRTEGDARAGWPGYRSRGRHQAYAHPDSAPRWDGVHR